MASRKKLTGAAPDAGGSGDAEAKPAARGVADPVDRLADMAHALEEMISGDLTRQLPISTAQDELDAVAYGVNILVGELAFATAEVQRARAQAEAASMAKSSFLRNASHELRTPLAVIVWLAELVKDPERVPADRLARSLSAIRRSAQELLRTTEEVLDLSRLDEQTGDPPTQTVDLLDVIREAIENLQPLAERKGIQLKLVVEDGVRTRLETRPPYVRQVLVNLLANAIKFSADGDIVVRVQRVGQLLAVDVEDPGIGIPDEAHHRIFEPFFQVDRTVGQRLGGTGVGLTLAKRLSERLGGNLVLAASREGAGSIFRLTLPRGGLGVETTPAPLAGTSGTSGTVVRPPPATLPLGGLRILVADDEQPVREALCKLLEAAGATVGRAANGEEAASRALDGDFGMVLMDVRMPVLDGLVATARLRAAGYRKPIVALTASATSDQRDACLAAGCDDHLTKPVGAPELVAKLGAVWRATN